MIGLPSIHCVSVPVEKELSVVIEVTERDFTIYRLLSPFMDY